MSHDGTSHATTPKKKKNYETLACSFYGNPFGERFRVPFILCRHGSSGMCHGVIMRVITPPLRSDGVPEPR